MAQPTPKFISDEDMAKMSPQQPSPAPSAPIAPGSPKFISDEDMNKMDTQGPSIMERAGKGLLGGVATVGRAIDRYTGAPTRAAIGAAQEGENPLPAFGKQFGAEPELALTGKQLAQRAGVPNTALSEIAPSIYSDTGEGWKLKRGGLLDPTASGAAGFGLDVASDWTNAVPFAAAAKGIGKTAGFAAREAAPAIAKGIAKTADVVTGTKAATRGVEAGGELASKMWDTASNLLSPKVSLDYPQKVQLAIKHEIDPKLLGSAMEFGQTSTVNRLERALREGPTGEKLWEDYNKGYNAIADSFERHVQNISGGTPLNAIDAGSALKDSILGAQKKLFDGMEMTFSKVQDYAPGLRLDQQSAQNVAAKVNGIEKYAKGLVSRGVTGAEMEQGRQLQRAVNGIKASNGSYKQTLEAMQRIGKAAFNDKTIIGQVPPDIEKMRDLYFTLNNALLDTTRAHVNPQFANEIVQNNAKASEFLKNRSEVSDILNSGTAPEKMFKQIVESGDSNKIKALKNMLKDSPEEMAKIKGAFIQSLVQEGKEGGISFNKTANKMRQKDNQIRTLLDPKEAQNLAEVVSLGKDFGEPILSFSGTGASSSFRDIPKAVTRGFLDEKFLNSMKDKGRGLVKAPAESAQEIQNLPMKTIDFNAAGKGLLNKTVGQTRGPIESRLKAAQSVSPSTYKERKK